MYGCVSFVQLYSNLSSVSWHCWVNSVGHNTLLLFLFLLFLLLLLLLLLFLLFILLYFSYQKLVKLPCRFQGNDKKSKNYVKLDTCGASDHIVFKIDAHMHCNSVQSFHAA